MSIGAGCGLDDTAAAIKAEPEKAAPPVRRPFVLAAVMVVMFTVAISGGNVSTAMPTIVASLGGFDLFSWVFSAYLLCSAVTVPIYGKLADIYGRKPVFLFGTVVFLTGSALCGFAGSMIELILCRALQGIGAGAVYPVAVVIVADIYTPEQRARVQGYLSGMWGLAAIVGPAIGAFIVTHWHWSLVFWVNLPPGLLAIAMVMGFHREVVPRRARRIDYLGSALLMAGIAPAMLALVQGARFSGAEIAALIGLSVVAIGLFVRHERAAPEPMMPGDLWRNRVIVVGNLGALFTSAIMMSMISYLPSYVQGVLGYSPAVAGLMLTAMSLSWSAGSTVSGRASVRVGYRNTTRAGALFIITGIALLIVQQMAAGLTLAAIATVLVGFGLGVVLTPLLVSAQSAVTWEKRGVASSSHNFMRTSGQAIGAAVAGAVVNFSVHGMAMGSHATLSQILDPAMRAGLTPAEVVQMREVLAGALHEVYIICALFALVVIWLTHLMPRGLKPGTQAAAG